MFNLAYCLRVGIGSEIDYEAALAMYQRLASTGDAQGMKMVGNCRTAGLGTSVNEAEALEFFKKSNESDIYWCGKVQ
jgi:TPR repeat protein